MSIKKFAVAVAFVGVVMSSSVMAADSKMGYAGAEVGIGAVNNSIGTKLNWGLTAGYKFMPEFGAAVFFNMISAGDITAGLAAGATGMKLMMFGAEANYFFSGMVEGLSAGAKFGMNMLSVSNAGMTSGSQITFGPKVAYDYAIGSGFSVGAEVNYMITPKKTTTSLTQLSWNSSINIFNALATVKYWF